MWFEVNLSIEHDYDTIKNCWLADFETKDGKYGKNEGVFYIKLDKISDIVEVSNLVGEDIVIGTFCDEPYIKF